MKYKKYVDEGYAFWLSEKDEEVDVHFNEWYSPPKCYLDIGVRICKAEKANELNIYLPLVFEEYQIEDLFNRFDEEHVKARLKKSNSIAQEDVSENAKRIVENTACAIFNSDCEIKKGTDISAFQDKAQKELLQDIIRIKHGTRIDYIFNFKRESVKYETIERKGPSGNFICGVLLKIDCTKFRNLIEMDKQDNEKGLYIRFRVPHPPLQKKNLKKGVSSGTFLDAPSSNTLIQYMQRVNEIRTLPQNIREQNEGIEKQYIGKVMSMIAVNKKYEVDDSGCYKIRQFEYDLHKMYVPEDFINDKKKENINIYQWNAVNRKTKNERTNSFIFNIKIKRESSTVKDWLRYIFVAFISSIISIIFSWLFSQLLP